jgi:hypothetical protein
VFLRLDTSNDETKSCFQLPAYKKSRSSYHVDIPGRGTTIRKWMVFFGFGFDRRAVTGTSQTGKVVQNKLAFLIEMSKGSRKCAGVILSLQFLAGRYARMNSSGINRLLSPAFPMLKLCSILVSYKDP